MGISYSGRVVVSGAPHGTPSHKGPATWTVQRFASKTSPVVPPMERRLTSTQPRAVHAYIQNMLTFVQRHDLVHRVHSLSARSEGGFWNDADRKEWEVIDSLLLKGRMESEKKCPPKKSGRFPRSPDLDRAGKWVSYWKLRIRKERTLISNQSRLAALELALQVPVEMVGPLTLTQMFCQAHLATNRFAEVKCTASARRQQHLKEMGKFAGVLHKWDPQAAIRRIQASEKASRQFGQLRVIFRDGQASGFDRLDIPDENAVLRQGEPVPRISLVVQEEIEEVLLPHTIKRFRQHAETPFGNGERCQRLGRDCTSDDAKAISSGRYDYKLLKLSEEARAWLLQLKEQDFMAIILVGRQSRSTIGWLSGVHLRRISHMSICVIVGGCNIVCDMEPHRGEKSSAADGSRLEGGIYGISW